MATTASGARRLWFYSEPFFGNTTKTRDKSPALLLELLGPCANRTELLPPDLKGHKISIYETSAQCLEEETATHSSVLAWRIPWAEEPGGYSLWGRREEDTAERLSTLNQDGPQGGSDA